MTTVKEKDRAMPAAAVARVDRREPKHVIKTSKINIRVNEETLGLIDMAARVAGKTRTDFVVESASQHAIDVLLDQKLFVLDSDRFDAFSAALTKPLPSEDGLKKLMASKSPWQKS